MVRKWTEQDTRMRREAIDRKWKDAQQVKQTRPYIQILAVGDSRDHPDCTALDGVVTHIDDPWLKQNLPPHRPECRCTIRTLNERQLKKEGLVPRVARPGTVVLNPPIQSPGLIDRLLRKLFG